MKLTKVLLTLNSLERLLLSGPGSQTFAVTLLLYIVVFCGFFTFFITGEFIAFMFSSVSEKIIFSWFLQILFYPRLVALSILDRLLPIMKIYLIWNIIGKLSSKIFQCAWINLEYIARRQYIPKNHFIIFLWFLKIYQVKNLVAFLYQICQ